MIRSLFDKRFALLAGDSVEVVTRRGLAGRKVEHRYDHTGAAAEVRIRLDLETEDTDLHPMKAGITQTDPDLEQPLKHPIHDAIETESEGEK